MRSVYDEVDWSATPLGPRESWPALLRLLVDLCLTPIPCPGQLGTDLLMLYNDAYIPLLGVEKHSMGTPVGRPERWGRTRPASGEDSLREVMETGRAYHSGDQRLMINRHGYPEEA